VTSQVVHIEIDVGIDGDQIAGHAGDGVSQPRSFLGWLGLLGELDRLLGQPGSAAERSPAPLRSWDRPGRPVPGAGAGR
jgi:hypothetical protein